MQKRREKQRSRSVGSRAGVHGDEHVLQSGRSRRS